MSCSAVLFFIPYIVGQFSCQLFGFDFRFGAEVFDVGRLWMRIGRVVDGEGGLFAVWVACMKWLCVRYVRCLSRGVRGCVVWGAVAVS